MDVECKCNNCSGSLAFSDELAGQTVECPHCHLETVLFIPHGLSHLPAKPHPAPMPHQFQTGKLDAQCPRCNSENTVKCAMAWQSGTTTSSFSGLGIDLGGDVGGFGGLTKSTTMLAATVAPPSKKPINVFLILLLIVMGLVFLGCVGSLADEDNDSKWSCVFGAIFCLGFIGFSFFALAKDSKRRESVYNSQMHIYLRQWVCMRCGTIYEPR